MKKDDMPTKDGKFLGRLYECGICGMELRRKDGVIQRGMLVHRDTCYDIPQTTQTYYGGE